MHPTDCHIWQVNQHQVELVGGIGCTASKVEREREREEREEN